MDRNYYLDLAARGLRMPIGTDLALHERPDHAEALLDGRKLGEVMVTAARRWGTPLALSLMDLTLEKDLMARRLGIPPAEREGFHFEAAATPEEYTRIVAAHTASPRLEANLNAIRHVAAQPDLLPVGMTIGPFSLMTKLVADPITAVYMAGTGVTADQDPEVALIERTLELATHVIVENVTAQAAAGARALVVAEPAASTAFFSPNQLAAGVDTYERYVMAPNRRVADAIRNAGMDLFFHCCGELTPDLVRQLAGLDPVILSLGSSRKLWEDAREVPKHVVLFGNLPSKRFYSDELITAADVERMACDLLARMKEVGHPFILGSECDVLSVPGCEERILRKTLAMVNAGR